MGIKQNFSYQTLAAYISQPWCESGPEDLEEQILFYVTSAWEARAEHTDRN